MPESGDVPLAPLTTLGLGGPARRYVRAETADHLVAAIAAADAAGEPVLVLGGGSNLVVADAGFDGLVVHAATRGIDVDLGEGVARLRVAAGEPWSEVVDRAVALGLSGVECLAGIPGSTGATPMQNVGAYGAEVSDVIARVRAWDREAGELVAIERGACGFAYRSSRFRGSDRFAIVEVELELRRDPLAAPIRYAELARALGAAEGDRLPLAAVRDAVVRLRRGKGMVVDAADPDSRSAGSFFVNPLVDGAQLRAIEAASDVPVPRFATSSPDRFKVPAAWLIERAGFVKGWGDGKVRISTKHALALVHLGGGSTRELLDVARAVRAGVRARFGVDLDAEPVLIGCSLA